MRYTNCSKPLSERICRISPVPILSASDSILLVHRYMGLVQTLSEAGTFGVPTLKWPKRCSSARGSMYLVLNRMLCPTRHRSTCWPTPQAPPLRFRRRRSACWPTPQAPPLRFRRMLDRRVLHRHRRRLTTPDCKRQPHATAPLYSYYVSIILRATWRGRDPRALRLAGSRYYIGDSWDVTSA